MKKTNEKPYFKANIDKSGEFRGEAPRILENF